MPFYYLSSKTKTNKQKSPGIEVRLAGRLGEDAKGKNDFWFISPQCKHYNTHTQAHRRTLNVTFVGSKSVRGEYLGG